MPINTTKHPGTNSHLQGAGRRHKSNSPSRYLGAEGTLTGTLSMNPLAYHKRDGSCAYLLRMHVESRTGNPNNDQLNHEALLVAYVPAGKTDYCAALCQGDHVKVRYVVQTDTYLNREGQPTKKTYFSAKGVYHLKKDQSRPPRAPQRAGRSQPNCQDFGMGRGRT